MLFCSQQFLLFFCIVFAVYWALPQAKLRVYLLLIASFYFYASWNKWLAVLICVCTFMDYWVARGMEATEAPRWRRALVVVSLVVNLGVLVYFKYANFFLDSLEETLHACGSTASLPMLKVILPIGISFYTFEAINYTIDVYRRRVPAERNLAHFMLFITFFPHLIAGPIVRARDFLPQIRRPKHWSWLRLQIGMQFFLLGLFKKEVIADRMAQFVDPVFADPSQFGSTAVWLAVLAYAVQIYCDFSGYTDMALGVAHMLGYKLAINFNMPYVAANVSEFWRRWHISLSSWLRDYLFIPLGGSKGTKWQTCRNLLITMVLGGLWHGAAWTFIFWGLLHGVFLIAHRAFADYCALRPTLSQRLQGWPGTGLRMGVTFLCVCVGWVFFRATTFAGAWIIVKRMFIPRTGLDSPMDWHSFAVLALVVVAAHLVGRTVIWRRVTVRVPAPIWGTAYALLLVVAQVLMPEGGKVFIYFQF